MRETRQKDTHLSLGLCYIYSKVLQSDSDSLSFMMCKFRSSH